VVSQALCGRGQLMGQGGSEACRLVRHSTSCVQYCSWRASRIQLLGALCVDRGFVHQANIIAACCEHLLRWTVCVSGDDLANEIHLSCCNHGAYLRDIIEHPPNMFILDLFLLYPHHRDE
jgi:hypothetical protein